MIPLVKIDEGQLFDYMKCPIYYDGVYEKKVVPQEEPSMQKMLMSVARYFYLNLMNGIVSPTSKLKKRWDALCQENSEYVDTKKCIDGLALIMKLYNWAKKEQLIIAETNATYNFFVKGELIHIDYRGEIDAIAMRRDKTFEILITDFSKKMPDPFQVSMKLKYSLDTYGYLKTYGGKPIGVHIHHVQTDKDFFTYRTDKDFGRINRTIEHVGYCINEKLFYPHENVFCTSCSMKFFCKAWK